MNGDLAMNEGKNTDLAQNPEPLLEIRVEESGKMPALSVEGGEDGALQRPLAIAVSTSVDGDIGQLLRGAYRQTVEENIPDELMDLLNRLE